MASVIDTMLWLAKEGSRYLAMIVPSPAPEILAATTKSSDLRDRSFREPRGQDRPNR